MSGRNRCLPAETQLCTVQDNNNSPLSATSLAQMHISCDLLPNLHTQSTCVLVNVVAVPGYLFVAMFCRYLYKRDCSTLCSHSVQLVDIPCYQHSSQSHGGFQHAVITLQTREMFIALTNTMNLS